MRNIVTMACSLAILVATSGSSEGAVQYEPVTPPAAGLSIVQANSQGLLAVTFGETPGFSNIEVHFRPDGGNWQLLQSMSGDGVSSVTAAVSEDRYALAYSRWSEAFHSNDNFVEGHDMATGTTIVSTTCSPLDDDGVISCYGGKVLQSKNEIYRTGPWEFQPAAWLDNATWYMTNPPLWRRYQTVDCFAHCSVLAPVDAIAQLAGDWFAFGNIQSYLEQPIGNFVRTEAGAWTDAGMSYDGTVYALHVFDNEMFAGGSFSTLDGQSTPIVARWTGSTWGAIAPGLGEVSATVTGFAVFDDRLWFNVQIPEPAHQELWAWDGQTAAAVETASPAGRVLGTSSELYVFGDGHLSRVAGLPLTTASPLRITQDVELGGAVPNPFNPRTRLRFELAQGAPVEVVVYDLAGRRVRTLLAARSYSAGRHELAWDGLDDDGQRAPSGVYFCRLRTDDVAATTKMTLIK